MYLPTSKVYVPRVRAHLVDMPDEMWQQIGVAAKATKVSRAAWIREVIAAGLKTDGIRPATATPAAPMASGPGDHCRLCTGCVGFAPKFAGSMICKCGHPMRVHPR
jgi:hypothetical protein